MSTTPIPRSPRPSQTKIVATIGPACAQQAQLAELLAERALDTHVNVISRKHGGGQRILARVEFAARQGVLPGMGIQPRRPQCQQTKVHHLDQAARR